MKPPTVPQVTVPTTLSAGEFSAIAGVTDERHRVKELIRHPGIIPRTVVLDPAVTVHTPEWLWLSTGIRAVDHCVEGICSGEANPYADAQALHGLSLLARGLPRVKADPSDLEARLDCQIGSWLSMGPLASGVPMGASHGIGYVLGAMFDIPHGHTSCIMLPAVMRWNKAVNARAPGAGRGRDGPSRRGCRRRARSVHRRARHAAQPRRGQDRARTASTGWPSRRWARPGCRATRGRSPARRRFARSWNWRHNFSRGQAGRGLGRQVWTTAIPASLGRREVRLRVAPFRKPSPGPSMITCTGKSGDRGVSANRRKHPLIRSS